MYFIVLYGHAYLYSHMLIVAKFYSYDHVVNK